MPLPLLLAPLLGMGAMAAGRSLAGSFADAEDERYRASFADLAAQQQEGIDAATPEGQQALALRQMRDPRTAAFGGQFFNQALQRQQQEAQFQQEFGGLSAYQQAQMDQQMQMAQMKMQADKQAQKMFTPQQLSARQFDLYNQFNKDLSTFRDQATYYDQFMGLIGDEKVSPADATAAIVNFVKITDPGSIVSSREGDTIREGATGAAGQLRDAMNAIGGKGLTAESRLNLARAATKMINSGRIQANQRAADIDRLALGVPSANIPAVTLDINRDFLAERRLPAYLEALANAQGGKRPGMSGKVQRLSPEVLDRLQEVE